MPLDRLDDRFVTSMAGKASDDTIMLSAAAADEKESGWGHLCQLEEFCTRRNMATFRKSQFRRSRSCLPTHKIARED